MRSYLKLGIAVALYGYFVACAPVKFETIPNGKGGDPQITRSDICPKVCSGSSCVYRCSVEKATGAGKVDILIVNDNSGSMAAIQKKMGDRFPTFLQSLTGLDYRIAMTTTDISSKYTSTPLGIRNDPGPYNGYGALQDGNLIDFGSGVKYLTPATSNKESLFYSTVSRGETTTCETSGYKNCPSDDERGVFAANLVLDRTVSQFAHSGASHFALVILANEDERGLSDSRGVRTSTESARQQDLSILSMYPLENYDRPETFVSKFRAQFPDKTLSVHPIIVKPGDSACLSAASNPTKFIFAREGFSYANLQGQTGGTLGSICDGDFGPHLSSIGSHLKKSVDPLPFACRPIGDQYKVYVNGVIDQSLQVVADFSVMQLKVNSILPPNTQIRLEYDCVVPL